MFLMFTTSCTASQSPDVPPQGNDVPGQSITITGIVRHVPLEGGFYGIEGRDGTKYDPVNLPGEYRQDGLAVQAKVTPVTDMMSIRMWGRMVRIVSIQRIGQED